MGKSTFQELSNKVLSGSASENEVTHLVQVAQRGLSIAQAVTDPILEAVAPQERTTHESVEI